MRKSIKPVERVWLDEMAVEPPLPVLNAIHKIKWVTFNDQEATDLARAVLGGAIDILDERHEAVEALFK